jgi:hypothetical protein
MRMFENRVLRKTLGPTWSEISGECRRLHKEELYDLQLSNILAIISRIKSTGGPRGCVRDKTSAYRDLVGRPERMRPLGRPRRRWEGNFVLDLQEVVLEDMYRI